jgi:hypothetical protein
LRRAIALVSSVVTALGCVVAGAAGAAPAAPHARAAGGASPALGIKHVFVIVLENEDYSASYVHNKHHWLGHKLQRQGTLLTRYYGTGHASLDNYLAMMSGQAPNPTTSGDCPQYVDVQPSPAVFDASGDGQAVGAGCVYPKQVKTLPDQLKAVHRTWHGYMEDMGRTKGREERRCGRPGSSTYPGTRDQTQSATAHDQYAARHNPFAYFHSLIDSKSCRHNVVPLRALRHDLRRVSTTRNFSFITPNLCDDGHDGPCAGKDAKGSKAGGLTSIDHFLSVWVPRIESSRAFRRNGLLIITTDEASTSDTSSCCGEQPGPNDPKPGITGPGGGRTGALVIGKCVARGRRDSHAYNHYSLLRSLEDIFGVRTGGSDGHGHLGYAGAAGLRPFGKDLFSRCA